MLIFHEGSTGFYEMFLYSRSDQAFEAGRGLWKRVDVHSQASSELVPIAIRVLNARTPGRPFDVKLRTRNHPSRYDEQQMLISVLLHPHARHLLLLMRDVKVRHVSVSCRHTFRPVIEVIFRSTAIFYSF